MCVQIEFHENAGGLEYKMSWESDCAFCWLLYQWESSVVGQCASPGAGERKLWKQQTALGLALNRDKKSFMHSYATSPGVLWMALQNDLSVRIPSVKHAWCGLFKVPKGTFFLFLIQFEAAAKPQMCTWEGLAGYF